MSLIMHSSADEPESPVHQPISFHTMRQVEHCSAEQLRGILSVTPQITITVTGTSMTPFIRSGERVTLSIVENPLALKSGEIILFTSSEGGLLLHRTVARLDSKNIRVQTKGDNRLVADRAISPDMVIAKVVRLEKTLPFLGRRSFNLESKSGKLIGKALAQCSRLNIYLRGRCFLSKLRSLIPLSGTTRTKSTA